MHARVFLLFTCLLLVLPYLSMAGAGLVLFDDSCDKDSYGMSAGEIVSQTKVMPPVNGLGYITSIAAGIGSWGTATTFNVNISSATRQQQFPNVVFTGRCCYARCVTENNMAKFTLPVPFLFESEEAVTISFQATAWSDKHWNDNTKTLRMTIRGHVVEDVVDECVSAPCRNGGTCVDGMNSFECKCTPGYAGAQCETDVNECVSAPCRSGGSCVDRVNSFVCVCLPGWLGATCQISPGRLLFDDSCNKDSYEMFTGEIVSQTKVMPAVNGSGYITSIAAGIGSWGTAKTFNVNISSATLQKEFSSVVFTGRCCYYDAYCATENNMAFFTLPTPFLFESQQEVTISFQATTNGDKHWDENTKTLRMTIRGQVPCESSPCLNLGTCKSDPNHFGYICQCRSGYSGVNCEQTVSVPNVVLYDEPCDKDTLGMSANEVVTQLVQMPNGTGVGYIKVLRAGLGSWGSASSYDVTLNSSLAVQQWSNVVFSGRCCYARCVTGNNMASWTIPADGFQYAASDLVTVTFKALVDGEKHYQANKLRMTIEGTAPM